MKQVSSRMAPAGYILVILLLWELAVRLFHIPLYILPAPTAIAAALGEEWPVLVSHGAVTVLEALAGILISLILALALGILMDRFPAVQRGIYPLLVVTQTGLSNDQKRVYASLHCRKPVHKDSQGQCQNQRDQNTGQCLQYRHGSMGNQNRPFFSQSSSYGCRCGKNIERDMKQPYRQLPQE